MTQKHTPTPWLKKDNSIVAKNGYVIARISRDERSRGKDRWEARDYEEANAAFIVRACNSHEQLVEALQAVADSQLLCGLTELHDKTLAKVFAALKSAGVE